MKNLSSYMKFILKLNFILYDKKKRKFFISKKYKYMPNYHISYCSLTRYDTKAEEWTNTDKGNGAAIALDNHKLQEK